jgi:hypothetical protein
MRSRKPGVFPRSWPRRDRRRLDLGRYGPAVRPSSPGRRGSRAPRPRHQAQRDHQHHDGDHGRFHLLASLDLRRAGAGLRAAPVNRAAQPATALPDDSELRTAWCSTFAPPTRNPLLRMPPYLVRRVAGLARRRGDRSRTPRRQDRPQPIGLPRGRFLGGRSSVVGRLGTRPGRSVTDGGARGGIFACTGRRNACWPQRSTRNATCR